MITTIIISLLLSTILHELAHLLAAKKVGCKIESISLGFGKTLMQFNYNNIKYKINLFLFGGDCQLKGEKIYSLDKDAFCNLSYRKKVYIGIAGCSVNLLLGIISILLGNYYLNYFSFIFGYLNLFLGIFNLLPIPCLDGSYLVFIWLEKFIGQERGFKLFIKINQVALKIWIVLNLLSIPYVIYYLIIMGVF